MKAATAISLGMMLALDNARHQGKITVDETILILTEASEYTEGLLNGKEYIAQETGEKFSEGSPAVVEMDGMIERSIENKKEA